MKLTKLANEYAVARAQPAATVPEGFLSGPGFRTVSRTGDELSLVGPADAIAGMDRVERGWTAFKVHGPFAFDEVGIVAALSRALSEVRIGIFVISTYDTDYILVKQADAEAAIVAWSRDGHEILKDPTCLNT